MVRVAPHRIANFRALKSWAANHLLCDGWPRRRWCPQPHCDASRNRGVFTDQDEPAFTPGGVGAISPGLSVLATPGVRFVFSASTLEGSQKQNVCFPRISVPPRLNLSSLLSIRPSLCPMT
ncbi:MAG: hypothetical protein JWN70_700 [Planctomycetaceae bacterium]|nr:hypothetical protein [Planctomycetaceae bacterium]